MKNTVNEKSIILTISFSQFVMPFMFSGVGITLPSLGLDLGASGIQLGLIESIYLGAAAAVLLPFGKLADLTDKKTIFKAGLFIYMLVTALLGMTQQIEIFIGLRLLQGIAGGMLLATNMAILSELIPKQNLGKAIGLAIGAVYLGLTTGPFVAGFITSQFGWRFVYYLGGILIGITTIASFINIPSDFKFKLVRIDYLASLLIMTSISCLVMGSSALSKGVIGFYILGIGLLLFAFFIFNQKKSKTPLVDLKLITSNNKLRDALLLQLINYAGTFGITFLFSLYLQTVKLMSPRQAGMTLMISPIIMATLAPFFGKLSDRVSPRKITFLGMTFCFISTLIALTVTAVTSMWIIYIQFAFMGLGFAMFSSPNMNMIMSSVEKKFLSMTSAIVAELRSLGMVISLTIISIFLSLYVGHHELKPENSLIYLKAMHFSILCFVILMGTGVTISFISLKSKR